MNNLFLNTVCKIKDSLVKTSFLRGGQFSNYNGDYHCDCSSLISSILKIERPQFFQSISHGKSNLKSSDFFNFAKESLNYTRNIEEILPGSLICWRKDQVPKSGDSGHIAIILDSPIKDKLNFYKLRVFDSTKTPHSNDSRAHQGVGEGDLYLQCNGRGEILGLKWSDDLSKVKRTEIISFSF